MPDLEEKLQENSEEGDISDIDNEEDLFFEKFANLEEADSKTDNKRGYYCKLCGCFTETEDNPKQCYHCDIFICKKCTSNGMCINCFINLKDDGRKTLKLAKIMAIGIPFVTSFLIFQGVPTFLIIEATFVSFFVGLFYISRWYMHKHSETWYEASWEAEIKTKYYRKLTQDPKNKNRYVFKGLEKGVIEQKKKRIEKLEDWIKPNTDFSDAPIPAYIKKHQEKLKSLLEEEEKNFPLPTKNNEPENLEELDYSEYPTVYYHLIGKECPKCREIISFADFCPNCNIRFCPECNEENSPHNKRCICGNHFIDLRIEFDRMVKKS